MNRHGEVTAGFLGEIDRYAGVNAALTVEQLGVVSIRHDRAVPDARMDVGPVLPSRRKLLNVSGVTSSPGSATGTTKLSPWSW